MGADVVARGELDLCRDWTVNSQTDGESYKALTRNFLF